MIAWLSGSIIHIEENEIVLNCNNVGYRVLIGSNLGQRLELKEGKEIELVTYTIVKEDTLSLIGFDSFSARKIFTILLSVNGVGPKAAMNIMDQIPPDQVILAIKQNNHIPFLQVSGIGKKTAQRIVLDLQGKINKLDIYDAVGSDKTESSSSQTGDSFLIQDAKSALSNLGFIDKQIDTAIQNQLHSGITLENLIRECLKELQQ